MHYCPTINQKTAIQVKLFVTLRRKGVSEGEIRPTLYKNKERGA